MPATTKHILTNVERMTSDAELLKLWNHEIQAKNSDGAERTAPEAWAAFIEAADAAKIADRIPGSVGKRFAAKYASEGKPEPKAAAKRTTRKASTKAAGK